MDQNRNICWKVLRVALFAVGVGLGLVGFFLALDAFIPKERTISAWGLVAEFAVGVLLIALAVWLVRKNRLSLQRPKS
jgi:cytochrome c biogenesis protein CcdA